MNRLPPDASDNAATDDDQHWLDMLAGRQVPQADAATRQDAQRLRTALLACQAVAPAGAAAAPEARIARLLSRARAATLLPALPAAPAAPPPPAPLSPQRSADSSRAWLDHWRAQAQAFGWRGAAAGLALAALAVTLAVRQGLPEPAAPEVMRGSAVQQLAVPHPEARQQALLAALRAAGFEAQPYTRLGRPGLDITLPVPLPPAQAQALARLGLAVPDGPSLQLELLPSAP